MDALGGDEGITIKKIKFGSLVKLYMLISVSAVSDFCTLIFIIGTLVWNSHSNLGATI